MSTLDNSIQRATGLICEVDALVITAGAGMRVDSGLPDFRGKDGKEVIADVERPGAQIRNQHIRSCIPENGWTLEAHSVPNAARRIVSAVKRMFGVEVRLVRATGLDKRLQFNGI